MSNNNRNSEDSVFVMCTVGIHLPFGAYSFMFTHTHTHTKYERRWKIYGMWLYSILSILMCIYFFPCRVEQEMSRVYEKFENDSFIKFKWHLRQKFDYVFPMLTYGKRVGTITNFQSPIYIMYWTRTNLHTRVYTKTHSLIIRSLVL